MISWHCLQQAGGKEGRQGSFRWDIREMGKQGHVDGLRVDVHAVEMSEVGGRWEVAYIQGWGDAMGVVLTNQDMIKT